LSIVSPFTSFAQIYRNLEAGVGGDTMIDWKLPTLPRQLKRVG
jgi:hypothetical protein